MIILDTVGDTLQAEASEASAITVSCYGIETTSGVESYVKLGQDQLTGGGTKDTLYTVPANSIAMLSVAVFANTSAAVANVSFWHVPNAGSAGDDNAVCKNVTIAAKSSIVWNKGNIAVMPGDTAIESRLIYFTPQCNQPPATNFASLDSRNGHPVLDFDDTTNESAIFTGVMPRNYTGGGVTVYLHYAMTSAEADTIDWDVAFERIGDQQQDLDSDGFAAVQSVNDTTVPGTTGLVDIVSIAFANGAEMDSVAAGEAFRIKVTRDAASDDAAGDAELLFVEIKET